MSIQQHREELAEELEGLAHEALKKNLRNACVLLLMVAGSIRDKREKDIRRAIEGILPNTTAVNR